MASQELGTTEGPPVMKNVSWSGLESRVNSFIGLFGLGVCDGFHPSGENLVSFSLQRHFGYQYYPLLRFRQPVVLFLTDIDNDSLFI